jgi:hypothetical protein
VELCTYFKLNYMSYMHVLSISPDAVYHNLKHFLTVTVGYCYESATEASSDNCGITWNLHVLTLLIGKYILLKNISTHISFFRWFFSLIYCLSCLFKWELHNLFSISNIIRMIMSERMRWAGYIAYVGEECVQSFDKKTWRKEGTRIT